MKHAQSQRAVLEIAARYSAVLVRRKRHYVWKLPNGAIVACGKTPSDARAMANIEKEFRRAAAG